MSKQSSSFPEEDIDTGKPLSAKGKKVFDIEFRYTELPRPSWWPKGWNRWAKYKTERARDEALKTLRKKEQYKSIEYRKGKAT